MQEFLGEKNKDSNLPVFYTCVSHLHLHVEIKWKIILKNEI